MDRPSRVPLYIGAFLLVCGWATMIVGWWQTGRQDLETGQLPYVLSGGFGGFGLLFMGATSVLVDVVRQAEWKLRRSAEELHVRMEELAESFVGGRLADDDERDVSVTRRPRGRARRSARRERAG